MSERLTAVAHEIAKVCDGKQPPIGFVIGWFLTSEDDDRLQSWVVDNTTVEIDGTGTNTAVDLIDAAIDRADGKGSK